MNNRFMCYFSMREYFVLMRSLELLIDKTNQQISTVKDRDKLAALKRKLDTANSLYQEIQSR